MNESFNWFEYVKPVWSGWNCHFFTFSQEICMALSVIYLICIIGSPIQISRERGCKGIYFLSFLQSNGLRGCYFFSNELCKYLHFAHSCEKRMFEIFELKYMLFMFLLIPWITSFNGFSKNCSILFIVILVYRSLTGEHKYKLVNTMRLPSLPPENPSHRRGSMTGTHVPAHHRRAQP